MTIDKDRLKALAEAATKGQWQAYDTHGKRFIEAIGSEDHVVCATPKKQWLKDSEFIAAANPQAVLALLAENDALRLRVADESNAATDARFEFSRLTEEYDDLASAAANNRKSVMQAASFLATITSSDGSGHADLARSVLRIAGIPDSEATAMVDQWVATRPWGNNNGEKK